MSTACYSCHEKEFQTAEQSESRYGEIFHHMRHLPLDRQLAECEVRSLGDGISADRRPLRTAARLRRLPLRQQLQPGLNDLRGMPPEGLSENEQPQPRATGIFPDLRLVPHHHGLAPAQFDHSKSGFPLTGAHTVPPRSCSDLGATPATITTDADDVRLVPPDGFQQRQQSFPCAG